MSSVAVIGPYVATQLGKAIGVNFNAITDQVINIISSKYIVDSIVIVNPSTSLTTAVGGFYTAVAKGGTAIVSAAQVYSALTGASKFLGATLAGILGTDVRTEAVLYLSLTIAQGATATADIYIFGRRLDI